MDPNPNIQRISLEEIQEFAELDLFNTTWESTNGRLIIPAYDPKSQKFVYYYAEPGKDGGDQNLTLFYGKAALIADFLDNGNLAARPSVNGFDNKDGIIAETTVGTVTKLDFYDVEIDVANSIDRYVKICSLIGSSGSQGPIGPAGPAGPTGPAGAQGAQGPAGTNGANGATGETGATGAAGPQGIQGPAGLNADNTLQKIITYPEDFVGASYTVTNADKGYSIIVRNGAQDVNIIVPAGLIPAMQVGFIRDGTGEVTFVPSATSIYNAIDGFRILGRYYPAMIEQGIANNIYYLLGNLKV